MKQAPAKFPAQAPADEPLQFPSLFDFVTSEIDTAGESLQGISAAATDKILEEVENSNLVRLPLRLVEPVRSTDNKADLVAGGADLAKRLGSLLRLQFKDRSHPVGPIVLEADPQLLDHYRKKIRDRLEPLIERAQGPENVHYNRVFQGLAAGDREAAQEAVAAILDRVVSTPTGILTMVSLLRRRESDVLWDKAMNACFLSMAVLGSYGSEEVSADKSKGLVRVGAAALFMDAALMLNPSLYDADTTRHAVRSAQIARDLSLDDESADAIVNHHRTETQDGKPIFRGGSGELSVYARTLVVVNFFIGSVLGKKARNREIEVIKLLNYLTAEGYIDQRAVKTLTRLYFSHQYAIFMEHANAIRNLCANGGDNQAVLWSVLGERNPYKFICQHDCCTELGSQVTEVSTTIPITLDGQVVAKIPSGSYLNCKRLTDELGKLHREMAALRVK